MNQIDIDLYRLAGYSDHLEEDNSQYLSNTEIGSDLTEINTGYSCVFNWANMNYTYVSDSIKEILGYEKSLFLDQGFNFAINIIHPTDLQKLREIYMIIFNYYYRFPEENRSKLRFSYNLRIKTADNIYIHVLRQSTFTGLSSNGKPTFEYINSTDITGFRTSNNITLTVHQISAAGTYELCSEHEFSKNQSVFTEREKQVLELVRQGFTTRQIACKLYLSVETIKSHRKHIIAKMGTGNMMAAINKAITKSDILYKNNEMPGIKTKNQSPIG